MARPDFPALLSGWQRHPAGRAVVLLAVVALIGVQAHLANHATRHASCSADLAGNPSGCALCAAAANFTATEPLVLLPGDSAFGSFLVPPALPPLPDTSCVPPSARGPPPAVV